MKHFALIILFALPCLAKAQTIQSISPQIGEAGQVVPITVYGVGAAFTSSTNTSVYLNSLPNGVQANGVFAPSGAPVNVVFGNLALPLNTAPGQYDVTLYTSNDGLSTLPLGFQVVGVGQGPKINYLKPDTALMGVQSSTIVHGHNTHFLAASSTAAPFFGQFEYNQATSTVAVVSMTALTDTTVNLNYNVPFNTPTGWHDFILADYFDGVLTKIAALFVQSQFGIASLLGLSESMEVAPNPTTDVCSIRFHLNQTADASMTITDATGTTRTRKTLGRLPAGSQQYSFSASEYKLQPGLYFIGITANGQTTWRKLVVAQ